jgi:ribose 1,5-bisphosphokinase
MLEAERETLMTARYAIYFAPEPDSPWNAFGAGWLGRCAQTGRAAPRMDVDGVSPADFAELTRAPTRYGFHATLKAPFRLARGTTPAQLKRSLEELCARQVAFRLPPLTVQRLDRFLALVPSVPERRVDALAAACLTGLDRFRAPPEAEELARRRQASLTLKEERLMHRWGYPYVLDRFRFHFSLTGNLSGTPPQTAAALQRAASRAIAALGDAPLRVDAVCLFREAGPGTPFRLAHRAPFGHRGRLIYVMGPSGAGKDSLLAWVRERLRGEPRVIVATRTITRPAAAGGEDHQPASEAQFDEALARGAFVMHWRANGHRYGIPRELEQWLAAGKTVIVNGSREYLPAAQARFPQIEAVHVSAPEPVLMHRLRSRGREGSRESAARLARAGTLSDTGRRAVLQLVNDGPIEVAGSRLAAFVSEKLSNVL